MTTLQDRGHSQTTKITGLPLNLNGSYRDASKSA